MRISEAMTPRERFLEALKRNSVDRPAIGTVTSLANTEAMDACGAAFPEAHLDAEKMAELAAFSSLEAGFDMIFPVFSVVHEAAALGSKIDWGARDRMPSILQPLWGSCDDVKIPADFERRPEIQVVCNALRTLKGDYGKKHAIIGKAFGPWSLSYHMFGVENILMMTLDSPETLAQILKTLKEATVRSALAQIEAGADVICLADHCSRDMCSAEAYRSLLFELHREITQEVPCPIVLHTCGDTSDRIDSFASTGIAGFHYDTRVAARTARDLAGDSIALVGGVNNVESLLACDEARIRVDVLQAVSAGIDIIGPECAIPLGTPMRSLRMIMQAIASDDMRDL